MLWSQIMEKQRSKSTVLEYEFRVQPYYDKEVLEVAHLQFKCSGPVYKFKKRDPVYLHC